MSSTGAILGNGGVVQEIAAAHPDSAGMSTLATVNVTVDFEGLRALAEVSFDLALREIGGLIGPNGAGKTTLVNVLTGFQRPDRGRVLLDGEDVTALPPHRLCLNGIARTFQAGRLFASLSTLENVAASGVARGLGRRVALERAAEMLGWIGMTAAVDASASALSYGDQRRVAIARALLTQPRFLLLDEPAAGMSDVECDVLIASIREIPERHGCGVLVIEHNMRVIMSLCSRIHVLDGGRTIAVGGPREIQTNPIVVDAYLGRKTMGSPRAAGR